VRLDPQVRAVLDRRDEALGAPAHELPIAQARAAYVAETAELSGPGEPVAEVRDLRAAGVPVRAFRPAGDGPLAVVAYLHGGGWATGDLETHGPLLRALANASGAIVAGIDYRLAPEHPFPAALEDSLAAVRWLAAHAGELGGDGARLAIAGDSAGGNLATVVARRLRGEVELRLQALIYPVTDAARDTPSWREFADGYGLTGLNMGRFWDVYLDGADGADPDVSPLRAPDLAGLPPAYIQTAEADVLRDEGEAYAAALRDAGVPVVLDRRPGTVHGFVRWLAVTTVAGDAVRDLGAALRRALS
jgi:acetyl esterase